MLHYHTKLHLSVLKVIMLFYVLFCLNETSSKLYQHFIMLSYITLICFMYICSPV